MPANVKTYDGTGDPDDHLKIFESAATIENWPQPVSNDVFEDFAKAFRLNFTQRKKCAKNPVELARVKQRQGESTSAYEKPPPRTAEKATQTTGHRNSPGDNPMTRVAVATTATAVSKLPGAGERQVHPTDNDPKGDTRNRRCKLPKTTTNAHSRRATHGERILLDHLVKNIKEGKDKQRSGGKKDAPRDKADTIYMVQSWQRKTKQKVSQKFSHGSGISFPTLTADNAVVEPLTIEINAAGHDNHRHVTMIKEHLQHTAWRTMLSKDCA
ncbi:hypothetical protein Tco_1524743 [Tanacetum coccineum]